MRCALARFAVCLVFALFCVECLAQVQRYDRIFVVPAPKRVLIDGDLNDWDLSASIECVFDEVLKPRFSVKVALMYDSQALYIGAHFVDDTPMLNRHDPDVEPNLGWAGDCLQVRLCSDPRAPYPLPNMESDRVCHLTMWYYTDKQLPVLHIAYGAYRTHKIWVGKDSGLAFRKDKDGKGYTLEARIPWERLNAKANPPKAGDRIALVVQPLWSDSTGWKQVCTFNDVIREAGFSFQNAGMWGQAIFLPKGGLRVVERPKAIQEQLQPLTLRLPLPDVKAKFVSASVFNSDGILVRTLPVIQRSEEAIKRGEKFVTITWDGLDDDGNPLPTGQYTIKLLTHRGIGQRYVTSLHNAGNPPWRTDDGTGSWGGDHAAPIAATSDGERVYLGWMVSEAGWAIVAVDPKLPKGDGVVTHIGKKFWGQHQVLEIGILVTALASDGERLFVAQDGKSWGGDWADPKVLNKAGVVLWEAKSGKPINFPFGKRTLIVSEWSDEIKPKELQPYGRLSVYHPLVPRKRAWERFRDKDFGPQELGLNLLGIAVSGDVLYASLFLEDKIVAINWRTGERMREFAIPRPCGLAVAKDGQVIAVSDKRLVRLNPQTGEVKPLVTEGLSSPWGVALDDEGNIYVTDCGSAMQVKVFDSAGKLLHTIGKSGGRAWVGKYDPQGMLRPSGITVDREGKVWVCEHDDAPRRVSVWTKDGSLVADLLGAGHYAVMGAADEQNPQWVNTHATLFSVDYKTGKWQVLATLIRPQMTGFQFTPDGFTDRDYLFRHIKGNVYLVHRGRGGVVIYKLGKDFVAQPVCAHGPAGALPLHGFTKDDIPVDEKLRDEFWRNPHSFAFWWTDLNGDGLVQADEFSLERVQSFWGLYWGSWVDDELTIWSATPHHTGAIWRIPVKEWLDNGVPVYPKPTEQKPFMFVLGKATIHSVMTDGDRLFVLEQEGGDAYGKGAKWQAISCYEIPKSPLEGVGKRLWAYRRVWLGFGLEAPLSKPGDVVGAMKFIGKAKLDNGMTVIAVNGYFGQFNLLTDEGLWVASLCKDNRYGPKADESTVWPENFSGFFFRNRDDGKVYLIAGDTDCRIWEVTGLESIQRAQIRFEFTEHDRKLAMKAAALKRGIVSELPPLRLRHVAGANLPKVDGDLSDWNMKEGVRIDAGGGRTASVALAYSDTHLLVAFDVKDDSPMRNSGKDFALLFKTGDACDVFLGTDPTADPRRTRPVAGDIRLLFSEMEGKPICVLYEAVVLKGERSPRLFTSPTGAESFDRVVVLSDAQVVIRRTRDGYTLEASVPLSAIGFTPKAGLTYKGDVGVIYSDAGGSRNVLRACYFNKETAIVNDIPTEARLQVGNWGVITAE
jgi:hypothetical protein